MANAEMGAIKTIIAILKGFINPKLPSKPLPQAAVLAGGRLKSGLSSIDIASEIIKRKKDIGLPIGPLPSGADSLDLQMETIRVEVIVEALISLVCVFVAYKAQISLAAAGTYVLNAAKIALVSSIGGVTFAFRTFFTAGPVSALPKVLASSLTLTSDLLINAANVLSSALFLRIASSVALED